MPLHATFNGPPESLLPLPANEKRMLFPSPEADNVSAGPTTEKLTRLDYDEDVRAKVLPFCRLKPGEVWRDPVKGHSVGLLDATNADDVRRLMDGNQAHLAVNDPPYNIRLANKATEALFQIKLHEYMEFSKAWVRNVAEVLDEHATFYVWLGADYKAGFQPMPDFMIMMREFKEFQPRNLITMRNQRGYGTQQNWMWVRQELLHYIKGDPDFNVDAEYTDIPKILRGYYKEVGGKRTENFERSKAETIRAGNVWVDVQQVFYRMVENVPGCYAQKPLKAIERIVAASSQKDDTVVDLFSHSGSTLLAGERLGRRVFTMDSDPIFAELTIRRLERYRATGDAGWQWNSPFPEVTL
jgi:site-specific DNA-methyltransferase (adenine-specific)